MDTCPKCHRKLLAHSSSRCNWCGAVIDDTAYQEEAGKKREEFFAADREEQAKEIADVEAIDPTLEPFVQYHAASTFLPREVFERRENDPPVPAPLDDADHEQTADPPTPEAD